jgi:hypothetical protein
MNTAANRAVSLARKLRGELPLRYVPPSEGMRPKSEMVLPHSLVKGTRGYIERIVYQVNGCYEYGWYDACAVMMRRLLETLIIEVFEHYNITSQIKNSSGDFLHLADLISATLSQPSWNLGRNTKQALPRMKSLGDQSAHSRRFVAHREDVDKMQTDFRTVVQELLFLAKLK